LTGDNNPFYPQFKKQKKILYQTEALVGIMLLSHDPCAQSLLRDIERDPIAHKIISWVDASPYSVKGHRQYFVASTTKKYESSSHHPSNEWQDAVVNMLNAGRTDHPLYYQLPSPATPSTCLDHDLPQTLGKLSLNEDDQVRHHGQASRLYLLGDQERLDNRYNGGIWYVSLHSLLLSAHHLLIRRFPGTHVWLPLPPIPQSVSHSLPPIDEQDHLLCLYFTHVHPPFPIIHKAAFWDTWNNQFVLLSFLFFLVFHTLLSIDSHLSPLLLFAMFSIAACYDAPIMYSPLPLPQNPVPSPLPLSQQTVSQCGLLAKITSTRPSSSFNPVLPLHVKLLAKPSFSWGS